MTTISPEQFAELQEKASLLEDEASSLRSMLAFRSSQVSDLETELAGRLLEIVRLKAENEALKAGGVITRARFDHDGVPLSERHGSLSGFRPSLEDYRYLMHEFTRYSGVRFDLEHVHEVLTKSDRLLAGCLEWGAGDSCVRDSLEEELWEYLLGKDGAREAHTLPEEELAVRLKKAGIARGMRPVDDEYED